MDSRFECKDIPTTDSLTTSGFAADLNEDIISGKNMLIVAGIVTASNALTEGVKAGIGHFTRDKDSE